jgi:transposase, IS5 family
MLVDRYDPEDVFARVPEVAAQTDPVLKRLDPLLEDDQLYRQVRADLGKRYRFTLVHGRHSTPVEVILRLLLCKHLYGWSRRGKRESGWPTAWCCVGSAGSISRRCPTRVP